MNSPLIPVVAARDLRKVFGSLTAIDGITVDFVPGRIYGLLGPNGSGKTTLIRIFVGLARPTSGTARVLGSQMPDRQVLGRIGYMTQADGIYGDLSVVENVRFFAALYGVTDRTAIDEALDLVDLGDRHTTPVEQL